MIRRGGVTVENKASHVSSTLHRVLIMAELRVLASHTGSLGSVAQGAWILEDLSRGEVPFFE